MVWPRTILNDLRNEDNPKNGNDLKNGEEKKEKTTSEMKMTLKMKTTLKVCSSLQNPPSHPLKKLPDFFLDDFSPVFFCIYSVSLGNTLTTAALQPFFEVTQNQF